MKSKQMSAIITAIVAVIFLIQGLLLQLGLVENYAMFIVSGVCFMVCFLLLIKED